ncbi:winged helix-turn-helix domain-containing protein [Streptomyces sp. DSM 41493]
MELSIAVRVLQLRNPPPGFGAWRRQALAGLDPSARMVFELIPATGRSPAFLSLTQGGSPEDHLELVRSTPRTRIREDLARLSERQVRLPRWAQHLGEDQRLLRQLHGALGHLHERILAPHWPRIESLASADRALRIRQLSDGGVHGMLSGLNSRRIRWNPPVLEVTIVPGFHGDLYLEGRGLLLIPSLFAPIPFVDPKAVPQPYLAYSLHHDDPDPLALASAPRASSPAPNPLAALLGRTRAAVLSSIAEHPGRSTSELAAFVDISPASASEHATVLRAAGLISTARHRNTALHTITPTGSALLNAPAATG